MKKNTIINKEAEDDDTIRLDALTGGVSWKNTRALITTCDISTKNGMTRTSVDINKISDVEFKVVSNNHKFETNKKSYGIFENQYELSKILSNGINIDSNGWLYSIVQMTSDQEYNVLNFDVQVKANVSNSNIVKQSFTTKKFIGSTVTPRYIYYSITAFWTKDLSYTTSINIKLVPNGQINDTTTSAIITFVYNDKQKDTIQKNNVNMLFFEN